MSKKQIHQLCRTYDVTFDAEAFLHLVVFAARTLGVLNRQKNENPLDKLENKLKFASHTLMRGPAETGQNLCGNFAVLFYYLHHNLGDLIYYKPFVDLMVKYIDESRDRNFREEIESEKTIFLSMVYEPLKWQILFGRRESFMQVRDVRLKFTELNLPYLGTLRKFIKSLLREQCRHDLKVIVSKEKRKYQSHRDEVCPQTPSSGVFAKRLLTWMNQTNGILGVDEILAIREGKLEDITERIQPLIEKVLTLNDPLDLEFSF